VSKILDAFDCNLDAKSVIVTDRGANMVSAFKENVHINCIDHLLNNILEKCMEREATVSFQSKLCRKLVKYFKKSGLNPLLKSSLKGYSPTRWNTMFFVFQSIEQNWADIDKILRDKNELHRVLNININHVREMIRVLECFCNTSKVLEGDDYPTMHFVYRHTHSLKIACSYEQSDTEFIKSFKA